MTELAEPKTFAIELQKAPGGGIAAFHGGKLLACRSSAREIHEWLGQHVLGSQLDEIPEPPRQIAPPLEEAMASQIAGAMLKSLEKHLTPPEVPRYPASSGSGGHMPTNGFAGHHQEPYRRPEPPAIPTVESHQAQQEGDPDMPRIITNAEQQGSNLDALTARLAQQMPAVNGRHNMVALIAVSAMFAAWNFATKTGLMA